MSHQDLSADIIDLIRNIDADGRTHHPTHPWSLGSADRRRVLEMVERVVRHQLKQNLPYRRYVERQGAPLDADLQDLPPIPTDAFKRAALTTFEIDKAEACFRSSGTTAQARGRHHILDLRLAEASIEPPFRAFAVPDIGADERLRMVVLTPAYDEAPDSSLCFMLDRMKAAFGDEESVWGIERQHGLKTALVQQSLLRARDERAPVFLLGPSFAFVHLLEHLPSTDLRLPEGSRVFETGGFKGMSRSANREDLHANLVDKLGITPDRIFGEYGMSELSSQAYEPTLRSSVSRPTHPSEPRARTPRCYVPPPWCLVQLLDPQTLRPVEHGQSGQIAMFDVANAHSVSHVITGDIGRFVLASEAPALTLPDGWTGLPEGVLGLELQGRAASATPKGCSIAIDALISRDDPEIWP